MYLGLDLGTSGLKGLLIDEGQRAIAEASAPLTVSRPREAVNANATVCVSRRMRIMTRLLRVPSPSSASPGPKPCTPPV